ncbi:glutamine--tRNA ligase/YqeY domain fusion protein [Kangiella koreensis]|uniref:Glutamine--tRNA ligase n=1 Tax=Kangiella koreensis (strain DSM 16069 / JCM 12317 / KCTC 12182 / SW-125) TaxID=523791 RepID=C7R8P3_KANKD|nr:glutamine--tRNA ligase/YqeY domain fusion protein [Kangiella koreensis]ACV25906.1 glutaminyl-tRNA synthetase [Kangiella koreensis DSM 16069]
MSSATDKTTGNVTTNATSSTEKTTPTNFIRNKINEDIANNKNDGRVHTRFPPEPNGYLHVGHAKSICLNFGIARDYDAPCNLRFDDTNPEKESEEFAKAIQEDVHWLGFEWQGEVHHASDYFDKLYAFAEELIQKGKAYVDEQPAEQIAENRGNFQTPGKESPYRNRPIEDSLEQFKRMKAGEFSDGQMVLRAKIDMSHPNMLMRDPVLYRIKRFHHIRTGDKWCIYPMYDFTHCISDALEGITHSLCTLEFEVNRPLYDWVLDNITIDCHPQQIEFSRLNLAYTITSKRKLTQLVEEKRVDGWDDPRMPTISGMRRRGYTPASIRNFCDAIGISKVNSVTDMILLEDNVRDDLDKSTERRMAVLDPIKVVITNYPEDKEEILTGNNHPKFEEMGTRELPFSREVYIDRADYRESANKKYKRLVKDGEVRLRNAYVIKANEAILDENGEVQELHCTYDPDTLGKNPEGRKVRGVIHWVSAKHGKKATVRLYDRLFNVPNPGAMDNFLEALNPDSFAVITAMVEPSLAQANPEDRFQFEREGYFTADRYEFSADNLVFNRTVTLRDSWSDKDTNS